MNTDLISRTRMGAILVHRHAPCSAYATCTSSSRQTHGSEPAKQVESSRLRSLLLADDMGLGKTMSALARMIMYTRDQLVEFEFELELKLISMDEN